jgi:hypothetical protein
MTKEIEMQMSFYDRLLRADPGRRSRFHDGKGQLHIHPYFVRSLYSTLSRRLLGQYPRLPWLTYAAISALRPLSAQRRVIEFGAGSSTAWFSKVAHTVVSIENNEEWFNRERDFITGRSNVHLLFRPGQHDYITTVKDFAPFDVYLIDGLATENYSLTTEELRIACLEQAISHAHADSVFIIDNTDVFPALDARVVQLFSPKRIRRLSGWVPGILHPNETTIVYGAQAS